MPRKFLILCLGIAFLVVPTFAPAGMTGLSSELSAASWRVSAPELRKLGVIGGVLMCAGRPTRKPIRPIKSPRRM